MEKYTFDTSFPLSVRAKESSHNPATMVIDGYLSENEHFIAIKRQSIIKVYPPKEDGKYAFEKVTVTYRCTLWLFYDDKTRIEYHLYVPEDIIEKEILLQ